MRKLSEVITKELFFNAHTICKNACSDNLLLDVNLRIVKEFINSISDNKINEYYDKFIATDALYEQ